MQIIARALTAPLRQIATNAGLDASVILEKVKNSGEVGYGFDAYKEVYCDMISNGIVDPTKVTRSALENAASISAMLLTVLYQIVLIGMIWISEEVGITAISQRLDS